MATHRLSRCSGASTVARQTGRGGPFESEVSSDSTAEVFASRSYPQGLVLIRPPLRQAVQAASIWAAWSSGSHSI